MTSSWLSRLHTTLPPTHNNSTGHPSTTPLTPHTLARKSRDPNSTDYRFNINQKCIYERRLPGGSYITAHIQRLQSGYYDSPMVHEDRIENVRFVALNFVFHPARRSARFKSAEISVAVRRVGADCELVGKRPSLVGALGVGKDGDEQRDFGTQTVRSDPVANPHSALIRSSDALPPARMRSLRESPPRFLRHAPHLLFGAISPETLTWNFNLAGSLGVSQGPANATLSPSGGVNGSYKLFEMMRIQGSMRGLHSWLGRQYNAEDGEIVWTLEENRLQKSGLPREFTFVMLLTKGSGGYEDVDDIKLDLDIKPVVGGFMGMSNASVPGVVNNLMQYRPLHKEPVDLDIDVGQRFQPEEKGLGFNFAKLASDFDDFVWLPGNTWSTSEHGERGEAGGSSDDGDNKGKKNAKKDDKAPQLPMLSNSGDNTLNLRVLLDHTTARGSPAPINAAVPLPYTSLRPQQPPYPHSRGPSPLHAVPAPSSSITGSQRSRQSRPSTSASHKRRSITITSSTHPAASSGSHDPSQHQHQQTTPDHRAATDPNRRTSRSPTLRRRTSRSSLDREYNCPPAQRSSPLRTRPYTIHDPLTSPHAHFPSSADPNPGRPSSWYQHDDATSTDDEARPPPRTADSSASQATVVRHSGNGNATLSPNNANVDTENVGRRPSAAGSARSGRSSEGGRVSVRQAKVAQTPYPFTPTKSQQEREDLDLSHQADEDQDEGAEDNDDRAGPQAAAMVVEDVPKIAVPRKSSKRASGSHLRYVVESARMSEMASLPGADGGNTGGGVALPNGSAAPPLGAAAAGNKSGGGVSFNDTLRGDAAGWTVAAGGGDGHNAADDDRTAMVNGANDNDVTAKAVDAPAPYKETGFARSASGVFHDAAEELEPSAEGRDHDEDEDGEAKEKEKKEKGEGVGEGEFDRNNVI